MSVGLHESEEQQALRDALRRFLARTCDEAAVRRLMADGPGYDPDVWSRLAGEIGLPGLAVPSELGGAGSSWPEVAVGFEELGRSLACVPMLSTTLATAVLLGAEPAARQRYLPELAAGRLLATAVFDHDVSATAGALQGEAPIVVDGHVAELFLLTGPDGVHAVEGDAAGLHRTPLAPLDPTRKLARVRFDGVAATRVAGPDAGERGRLLGLIVLAAEQVGGIARVLEMSSEYARTRLQFGRPIGSFQAVKHKCADMLLALESARSLVLHAAHVAATGRGDLPAAAYAAASYCAEAFLHAAATNIQIHGGIGFTWEHPAHLYYRRAKSGTVLLGTPAGHRAALADALGL